MGLPVADSRLRALERRLDETGAPEDGAALIRARIRARVLVEGMVVAAAYVGDEASRLALGSDYAMRLRPLGTWEGIDEEATNEAGELCRFWLAGLASLLSDVPSGLLGPCGECDGQGEVEASLDCDSCWPDPDEDCEVCDGNGIYTEVQTCSDCSGSGSVPGSLIDSGVVLAAVAAGRVVLPGGCPRCRGRGGAPSDCHADLIAAFNTAEAWARNLTEENLEEWRRCTGQREPASPVWVPQPDADVAEWIEGIQEAASATSGDTARTAIHVLLVGWLVPRRPVPR